ncbi:hypothetical protein BH10PSE19_BH10PSE19_00860 [soil metagenome]
MFKKIIVVLFLILLTCGFIYSDTLIRLYKGTEDYYKSKQRAKYYELQTNLQLQDITQKLIIDKSIPGDLKKPLINGERRIIIFKYPSGSEYVAGYLSYLPKGNHPTVIFLRGGNGYYGIMRPNNRFSFLKGYNVVATLYRGNVYGGKDEYGGADIQDVGNLIKFFPTLEKSAHIELKAPFAMLGISRGAMEMFTALSQLKYVKEKINYAISASGSLDLNISMKNRPEMYYLYKNKFKQSEIKSFAQWIKNRNPVDNVGELSKSLKVLLIYGLDDHLVALEEQINFKKGLESKGISVQLITIPGATHGLEDHYDDFEKHVFNFIKK